jgi:hypothetical protein
MADCITAVFGRFAGRPQYFETFQEKISDVRVKPYEFFSPGSFVS